MFVSEEKTGTIWWVRHGPTHAKGMVGWSDIPADLSDHAALARLDAHLPGDGALVSSDLSRSVATADAIAGGRTRLPHAPGLREMHFGDWEMRSHAEIEAVDPARIRSFWENPGTVSPPGGESWNDLSERVEAALPPLLSGHLRLIVVAHFGVILSQAQRAASWSGSEAFSQRIEPLSVTRIEYGPRRRLVTVNHRP